MFEKKCLSISVINIMSILFLSLNGNLVRAGLSTMEMLLICDLGGQGSSHGNDLFKCLKVKLSTLTLPRSCIGRILIHWVCPFIFQWEFSIVNRKLCLVKGSYMYMHIASSILHD